MNDLDLFDNKQGRKWKKEVQGTTLSRRQSVITNTVEINTVVCYVLKSF